MKEKVSVRLTNVFIEIIILTLFFAIASAIIIKVYGNTIWIKNESEIRNNSIINSNSIIALYKDNVNLDEAIKRVCKANDQTVKNKENRVVNLSNDMIAKKDGNVMLVVKEEDKSTKAGEYGIISLKYYYRDKEIYSVDGRKYRRKI